MAIQRTTLTAKEASEYLGISYWLITQLVKKNKIPYSRMGSRILFRKDALGGGDVKMMAFVSAIVGYKLSIVIVFLGSFIALPFSIINSYKKNDALLPFGPYLAIATIILFLCNVSFDSLLEFIN